MVQQPTMLPPGLMEEEEEEVPPGFNTLFGDSGDLTRLTETPSGMILPLVRMRVVDQACNPGRKISLVEFYVQELDRRMISYNRKGRDEAVEVMQGALRQADEEEQAVMGA